MSLHIGSVSIEALESLDLDQTYEILGGEAIQRTVGGSGLKQMTWARLRVQTSGQGWLPPGLADLDTSQQMTLRCIVPRAIPCTGLVATLPAARRSDAGYLPYGIATLASDQAVKTSAVLVGNVATLAAVAGAVSYRALYYPELTVWAMRPSHSGSRSEAVHRWELICEEI